MGLFSNKDKPCPICGGATPRLLAKKINGQPICGKCNDEILASTVPEYMLFIDFRVEALKKDTFEKYVKPLSAALASKFCDKSAADYESLLRKTFNKKESR